MAVVWNISLSIGLMATAETSLTADTWPLVTPTCRSLQYTPDICTSAITNMTSLRIFLLYIEQNYSRPNLSAIFKFCNVFIRIAALPLLISQSKVSHRRVRQGWPNSRSRPLFDLYQKLFAASVRSIALRLTAFFLGRPISMKKPSPQINIVKSRHQSRLTEEHLKYCLHLCLTNYESSYSEL